MHMAIILRLSSTGHEKFRGSSVQCVQENISSVKQRGDGVFHSSEDF